MSRLLSVFSPIFFILRLLPLTTGLIDAVTKVWNRLQGLFAVMMRVANMVFPLCFSLFSERVERGAEPLCQGRSTAGISRGFGHALSGPDLQAAPRGDRKGVGQCRPPTFHIKREPKSVATVPPLFQSCHIVHHLVRNIENSVERLGRS